MKRIVTAAALAAALLVPAVPAVADEPIVRTDPCPEGYEGAIIFVGGRGLWWGCYRLP